MKKKLNLFWGFSLGLLFFTTFAFAQVEQPFCIIKKHPYDTEKARREINELCKIGYTPVGFEVIEGNYIVIIYLKIEKPIFSNWALLHFPDLSKIEAEYVAMLKNGWVPVGFSYTQAGHYVLFLKNRLEITGFRIVNVSEDLAEIEKTIEAFAGKNFLPYGISYFNNKIWIFFLGVKEINIRNLKIFRYKDVEMAFNQGIKAQIENGFIPLSIAFSNEWLYVVFFN